MKHPLVPRIYVSDVSLLWSLMWIMSHHPLPHWVGATISRACPVKFWRKS